MARTKYNREFKAQAVKLSYTGTKTVSAWAADLGVATNMLHRWRREYAESQDVKAVFPGQGRPRDEADGEFLFNLGIRMSERDPICNACTS